MENGFRLLTGITEHQIKILMVYSAGAHGITDQQTMMDEMAKLGNNAGGGTSTGGQQGPRFEDLVEKLKRMGAMDDSR